MGVVEPQWDSQGRRTGHPLPWLPSSSEHQNFFGLDEALGPVAVSLRREEKEGSGGGTLHSYRIIVRTTQVGRGHGIRPRIASSETCMDSEGPYIPLLSSGPSAAPSLRMCCRRGPQGACPLESFWSTWLRG